MREKERRAYRLGFWRAFPARRGQMTNSGDVLAISSDDGGVDGLQRDEGSPGASSAASIASSYRVEMRLESLRRW
jgi:hypothetical protein